MGGLLYEYVADQHGDALCRFSLFSEVGQPYQLCFAEFHQNFQVEGLVDYGNSWPFVADKLEGMKNPGWTYSQGQKGRTKKRKDKDV